MLRLIGTVCLVMLVVSYVLLQTEVVKRRKHYRINEKILVVADRPEVAKAMALGFDNMVADMMWIRGIQYFGGNFSSLKDPEKRSGFINLFDAMTALDSRFVAAWKFGGFVFNESCSSPKKAVEFLLKGAEANPDNWELLFDAGFISFYTLEDHETAKKAFLAACGLTRASTAQSPSRRMRRAYAVSSLKRLWAALSPSCAPLISAPIRPAAPVAARHTLPAAPRHRRC